MSQAAIGFEPFGPMHAAVVLGFGAATWALVRHAISKPSEARARLRRTIGLIMLGLQIGHNVYWVGFRGDSSERWPLHLCDLAGMLVVATFLMPTPRLLAMAYFWGVSLSSLAFIIPVLRVGPASVEFWSFWLSHWAIVGGAVYLALVERYRPTLRDAVWTAGVTVGVGLVLIPVNMRLGTNFMYVGEAGGPTAFLGSWPLPRLPLLALAALLLHVMGYLPWMLSRPRQRPMPTEPRA
ncbi:MAG: TIGR02206 family membrane protein [Planctomycetota bacterium]